MHWLFLLFATITLIAAVRTTSGVAMVVLLLLTLGLMAAWVLGWLSARLGSQGSSRPIIDPLELKRMRELAEARRREQAGEDRRPGEGP